MHHVQLKTCGANFASYVKYRKQSDLIPFWGGVSYQKSDDSHWLQYVSKFRCHQIRKSDKTKTDYH